jgi:nucleoside phosphorylase
MRRTLAAMFMLAALPAFAAERGRGLCATGGAGASAPRVVVLSAFPAEIAPLVAATTIESTIEIDGRRYHLGRLGDVRVLLGMTGIGLLNAEATATAVLARIPAAALIMSGVAGSHHRIGDVVVATTWTERDRSKVLRANPALLAIAETAAIPVLEQCTEVPPGSPSAAIVCMPHQPEPVFGGHGVSGDDYGDNPVACVRGGGDILGCELPQAAASSYRDVEDMETAAVARVAARRHVPFLGVRAVSDGAGDPLGDRGFPRQFFDYYVLAADNAAIVTRTVVAEIGRLAGDASARRTCRLLAGQQWRAAARRIRRR